MLRQIAITAVILFAAAFTAIGETGPTTKPTTRNTPPATRADETALQPYGMPGNGNPRLLTRVIFVCDASEGVKPRIDELRQELVKSVMSFRAGQPFNVIFVQGSERPALSIDEMVPVTASSKEHLTKFVASIQPKGKLNPIPALELAFKQRPNLIFLLAHGQFDDDDAVIKWLHEHNADQKIKINTLAFITGPNDDPEKTMTTIAKEHGGIFKKVVEKEAAY